MPRQCRKCLVYYCSKNGESTNFPARSIRNFGKRFTGGGEFWKMVEGVAFSSVDKTKLLCKRSFFLAGAAVEKLLCKRSFFRNSFV